MRMVSPRTDAPQVTVAEDQHEYKPITAALEYNTLYPNGPHGHNTLLLAYCPNGDDIEAFKNGKHIHIRLLTFGGPMQAIRVEVEP